MARTFSAAAHAPAKPPPPLRVGRTGRAGAKGTAITFIGPDEAQYSPDLVKALKESGAPIPQDLQVRPRPPWVPALHCTARSACPTRLQSPCPTQ